MSDVPGDVSDGCVESELQQLELKKQSLYTEICDLKKTRSKLLCLQLKSELEEKLSAIDISESGVRSTDVVWYTANYAWISVHYVSDRTSNTFATDTDYTDSLGADQYICYSTRGITPIVKFKLDDTWFCIEFHFSNNANERQFSIYAMADENTEDVHAQKLDTADNQLLWRMSYPIHDILSPQVIGVERSTFHEFLKRYSFRKVDQAVSVLTRELSRVSRWCTWSGNHLFESECRLLRLITCFKPTDDNNGFFLRFPLPPPQREGFDWFVWSTTVSHIFQAKEFFTCLVPLAM